MWSAWRLTPTRSSASPPSSPTHSGGSWSAAWSWARWAPGNMSQKSMASEQRGVLPASVAMASGRAAKAAAVWSSWWAARRVSSWVCSWSWTSLLIKLWQQWIKDRMEYYLRVEPVDAIRDEALDHSYGGGAHPVLHPEWPWHRVRPHHVGHPAEQSGARWPLPDPEAGGQEGQASVNGWGKFQTDVQ